MDSLSKISGLTVFAAVLTTLVLAMSATTVSATECGKDIDSVPVETIADGPQTARQCEGAFDPDDDHPVAVCPEYYWVKPAHDKCVDGPHDLCCRQVRKEAKYHESTCLRIDGSCTYGDEVAPPDGEVIPLYYAATLYDCNDGAPSEECVIVDEGED